MIQFVRQKRPSDAYGNNKCGLFVLIKIQEDREVLIGSNTITHKINSDLSCSASYVPVLQCHSLTVHRLQGMTFREPLFYSPEEMRRRSLPEFFVVLSRLVSLDLLYLSHLPPDMRTIVDPHVITFYKNLEIRNESDDEDW